MALAHHVPVRMTSTDRAALAVSAGIASAVAWRMERRRTRAERELTRRATQAVLAEVREEGLRRALELGVFR